MGYNKGRLFSRNRSIRASKKYKRKKYLFYGLYNHNLGQGWITKSYYRKF